MKPVTVGFDGSDESKHAVDFAVREAQLRRVPLRIVHSILTPMAGGRHFAGSGWRPRDAIPAEVFEMIDGIVEHARQQDSRLEVQGEVIDSMTVSGTMIEQSREADLVVLGSRGHGGFRELLLGSTSAQVSSHAHCPVVITRRPPEDNPPPYEQIVVGVDDSPLSQDALRFAFAEAQLTGADLVAVRAWQFDVPAVEVGAMAFTFDRKLVEEETEASLGQALAGWRQDYPGVTVIPTLRYGDPRHALLEAGKRARMMVLASRGRGEFARLILGSTSHAVLQHAQVPVAIISPRAYEDGL